MLTSNNSNSKYQIKRYTGLDGQYRCPQGPATAYSPTHSFDIGQQHVNGCVANHIPPVSTLMPHIDHQPVRDLRLGSQYNQPVYITTECMASQVPTADSQAAHMQPPTTTTSGEQEGQVMDTPEESQTLPEQQMAPMQVTEESVPTKRKDEASSRESSMDQPREKAARPVPRTSAAEESRRHLTTERGAS